MEIRHEFQMRRISKWSGKMNTMVIRLTTAEFREIYNWGRKQDARTIQTILPDHTPEEREFLISGLSLEEQQEAFGGDSLWLGLRS